MKRYGIKEIFATLQGEGAQAGTPAVFLRFAGCNLGYEICTWCDTDWVKAEHTPDLEETLELIREVARDGFGEERAGLLLVATGGEPSLQFDHPLAEELRSRGYRVAMETNGSRSIDRSLVDWLTVSPKQAEFAQKEGNELKAVFTGSAVAGITPDVGAIRRLVEGTCFDSYFLQPVEIEGVSNYEETVRAVMELGPPWRLSVQTHKVLGIR